MKKLLALFLSCLMLMTGCSVKDSSGIDETNNIVSEITEATEKNDVVSGDNYIESQTQETIVSESTAATEIESEYRTEPPLDVTQNFTDEEYVESLNFLSMNDPELLQYIEDSVYYDLVEQLNSEDYFVENVEAIYMPTEYFEEVEFNSQENIYFGYTASELDEIFQGTKYVFTLDENGQTTVEEMTVTNDDTYSQIIKNVAIGTGVILVCITVDVISGGAFNIFIAGSSNCISLSECATLCAKSFAICSGLTSAAVKGIETRNFKETLKSAVIGASDGFKCGAIIGAATGGILGTKNILKLKNANVTANGLKLSEAAIIQRESKFPVDVIKQFKSMDEYNVYKNAGLKTGMVNGELALIRDIDFNFKDNTGLTNMERMLSGLAPIDPATGDSYQLHHINQKSDGTLAILTEAEHQGNSSILNTVGKESEIDRPAFEKIRKEFWKDFAKTYGGL